MINEMLYKLLVVDEKNFNEILNKFLVLIFKFNKMSISTKTLNKHFNNFKIFIYNNIIDKVIKNVDDLKFYIINELNLTINNNSYLKKIIFSNEYKKFNSHFIITEI